MRAVIQRVANASVTVNGRMKGQIERGLVALLAIEVADTRADIEWLSGKIVRLRIFDDERGVMNRSVQEVGGKILLVSQFTLLADVRHGRRPGFTAAAAPDVAEPLVDRFVASLRAAGATVETGAFGATMEVELVNDGPFTLVVDSAESVPG